MNSIIRYLLSCFVVLFLPTVVRAEIPAGYYTSLTGKTGAELKTAVHNIIKKITLTNTSYDAVYSALSRTFQRTDLYPGTNRWWDMYSDIPHYAPSFSGLNREHSFPKSWWGGSKTVNAYIDLNHLYPAEGDANIAKSNYPLGEVNTTQNVKFDNGVVKVGYPVSGQGGGCAYVFEPNEEYRGDFARTYFYMVTCYQDYTWSSNYSWMLQNGAYPTLTSWAVNLLLRWAEEDPVSDKETARNEEVYKIQNNRNPFIDYPLLAEYIWGKHKGEPFDPGKNPDPEPSGTPELYSPVQDQVLEFGEVAVGKKATAQLLFQGENIKSYIDVVISRRLNGESNPDYTMFKTASGTVDATLINRSEGTYLAVTYTPTSVGQHQARLVVSEGGITGSRGVNLRGTGCPVPTLSRINATAATEIGANSYVANWDEPDGEIVDYYIVNRTRYIDGQAITSALEAEGNSLLIEGFDSSVSESYTVQSVRLGYTSPESNVIYVEHTALSIFEADMPLCVAAIPGGFRFITAGQHTDAHIYDVSGRLVRVIDTVDSYTEVMLPQGIYIVTTAESHRPQRVAVY